MEKDGHLKNQVLYITNPAYDALHSEDNQESLKDETFEEKAREQMFQADLEKS